MKNLYLSFLLFFMAIFGFSSNSSATHISGGDIAYECVGQDSFLVTLTLFRDCFGISTPLSTTVNFNSSCGGFTSIILPRQSMVETSQLCASQIGNSTCNGGTWPGLESSFYSGIVVLNSACNSWTMSWSSCCRNAQVSNLTNPSGLDTYLFAQLNTVADSCQSSPIFTSLPIPYVCMNTQTSYNFGVIDPDGDSIVYFLSPGYEASTTLTPYTTPYTFTQPLPGSNLILDSQTGQLTFTATAVGVYVVVVRVEKYDRVSGVLLGLTMRDIQVVVQNCTNSLPKINSPGLYNVTGGTLVDSNSLEVCVGSNLNFSIAIGDANTADIVAISHNIYLALDSTAVVTIVNGNPAVLTVSWSPQSNTRSFRNFSVTGLDNSCPVLGIIVASFDIDVKPGVNAGVDKSICAGNEWAALEGVGGTQFTWVAISGSPTDTVSSSPTYNMTCMNCQNPMVSPQITTSYALVSNITGSCGNVDTVTVFVSPNFDVILPADTILCRNVNMLINASVSQPTLSYTYQWSPSTGLSSDTILNPVCTGNGAVRYVLTANSGGCIKTDTIEISSVNEFPMGVALLNDTTICAGDSVALQVNFDNAYYTNCDIVSTLPIQPANLSVIGTGTNANLTGQVTPYAGRDNENKYQMLFDSTELRSMGLMPGGQIWSIALFIANTNNVGAQSNFDIKMGCTSLDVLDSSWASGLHLVYSNSLMPLSTGWNTYSFSNGYQWDGYSNVAIQICASIAVTGASNPSVRYTVSGANSCRYDYSSSAFVCSPSYTSPFVYNTVNRVNVRFGYHNEKVDSSVFNFWWTPNYAINDVNANEPNVSPNVSTQYEVVMSPISGGCPDTLSITVNPVTTFDAGFVSDSVFCINGDTQQFVPVVPSGTFTGVGITSSGIFNPALAGVGQWPINYNISNPPACSNDSTVLINVIGLPDVDFEDLEVCLNSSPINIPTGNTGGKWSGTGITDSINGTFDPAGLAAGNYLITYDKNTPCTNQYIGTVKIIQPYTFTLVTNLLTVCENDQVHLLNNLVSSSHPLQGTQPMYSFLDNSSNTDSSGVFDATGVTPGDYVVDINVTDAFGNCGTSQSVTIRVEALPQLSLLAEPSYCNSQSNVKIYVQPWLFGTGVTYSQVPLAGLTSNDTLDITPFGQNGQFNPQTVGNGSWEITLNYTNIKGCVSTLVDTIYVLEEADTTITNLGVELVANAGVGYVYQWLDCDNNMTPIPGANSHIYVPGKKGHYSVEISAGNCVVTSSCNETWPLGVKALSSEDINIYPNPVENEVFIELKNQGKSWIQLMDNSGKELFQIETNSSIQKIDLSNYPPGIYIVNINSEQGNYSQKVVKQ